MGSLFRSLSKWPSFPNPFTNPNRYPNRYLNRPIRSNRYPSQRNRFDFLPPHRVSVSVPYTFPILPYLNLLQKRYNLRYIFVFGVLIFHAIFSFPSFQELSRPLWHQNFSFSYV